MYKITVEILENGNLIVIKDIFIEYLFYNYIILNKPDEFEDHRKIYDVNNTSVRYIFKNKYVESEFYKFIEYLQTQKYDITVCNCFRNRICTDCMFLPACKLGVRNNMIVYSTRPVSTIVVSRVDNMFYKLFELSIQVLNGRCDVRDMIEVMSNNISTCNVHEGDKKINAFKSEASTLGDANTNEYSDNKENYIIGNTAEEITETDIPLPHYYYISTEGCHTPLRVILRQNTEEYINILYKHVLQDPKVKVEIGLLFHIYQSHSNSDLYLLNEALYEILKNCEETAYLNMFYLKFGEYIKYLNINSNLLRLIFMLYKISDFRMREVFLYYNIMEYLLDYRYTDKKEVVYLVKIYKQLQDEHIKKYMNNTVIKQKLSTIAANNGLSYLIS